MRKNWNFYKPLFGCRGRYLPNWLDNLKSLAVKSVPVRSRSAAPSKGLLQNRRNRPSNMHAPASYGCRGEICPPSGGESRPDGGHFAYFATLPFEWENRRQAGNGDLPRRKHAFVQSVKKWTAILSFLPCCICLAKMIKLCTDRWVFGMRPNVPYVKGVRFPIA